MLLGQGALANYHDIPAAHQVDFDHWHTCEHLPERVGLPGFLRGRRYRATGPETTPEYFILYETSDVQVLRSAPYLARLDAPTPWTVRVSGVMTRTIRTAATVRVSTGRGAGGCMLTVRLGPGAGDGLRAMTREETLERLVRAPGVCGAHLLEADSEITAVDTRERQMRDPPDESTPWMVLLEGTGEAPLVRAWDELATRLSGDILAGSQRGIYALQAVFALCDL